MSFITFSLSYCGERRSERGHCGSVEIDVSNTSYSLRPSGTSSSEFAQIIFYGSQLCSYSKKKKMLFLSISISVESL